MGLPPTDEWYLQSFFLNNYLNNFQILGEICDEIGAPLPPGTPPSPHVTDRGNDDWTPYRDWVQFKTADFLFRHNQMLAGDINFITGLWAASLAPHHDSPPFADAKAMYDTIDSTLIGDIPWQSFTLNYNSPPPRNLEPNDENPPWTTAGYNIWFHDPHRLIQEMIANPDFAGEFNFVPYQEYSADGQHCFEIFRSGDWAWRQVVSYS